MSCVSCLAMLPCMSKRIVIAIMMLSGAGAAATAGAQDFSGYGGEQLYQRFCASCHGASGRGDGPVAKSIRVETPDLTRITQRHGGTFPAAQVRAIIDGSKTIGAHGTRTMPVWGFEFLLNNAAQETPRGSTDQMIDRLTQYLHSLQRQDVQPTGEP